MKGNILGIVLAVLLGVVVFFSPAMQDPHHSMNQQREDFIEMKNHIHETARNTSIYRCCLMKPCMYCIEKTPGHGEGATCDCMQDIVNGVHPCGECIGEILEGHGNPYVAKYFARAISEKTGHEDAIKQIILEKYGIAIEEQV